MKKLATIAATLLAASMMFMACSNGVPMDEINGKGGKAPSKDPVVVTCDVASIALENNYEYDADAANHKGAYSNQQQIVDCLQNVQFAVGDVVEVEVKGSIEAALAKPIAIDLVDNTADAGWWCNIAGANMSKEILAAGETAIDTKVTFDIKTASTAKGAAKLQVFCEEAEDSNPVITITSLKVTIK